MSEVKGEPTDDELSAVDAKLLSPGWIHLLDGAGLSYRERQVIGWALRIAPRLRRAVASSVRRQGRSMSERRPTFLEALCEELESRALNAKNKEAREALQSAKHAIEAVISKERWKSR